jgi:hypothetical protein
MNLDGIVDITDIVSTNNNSSVFVTIATPCPSPMSFTDENNKSEYFENNSENSNNMKTSQGKRCNLIN